MYPVNLKVFCSNSESGCDWQGELGQLDQHLNLNPDKDKLLIGCVYTNVKCSFCGEQHQRNKIESHQDSQCVKRPFTCSICKEYKSTYDCVVNEHTPLCEFRPVECPNSCGANNLQHQHLEEHVSTQCPLSYVDCEFSDTGCDAKVHRKDLSSHMEENIITHVSLLARENRKLKRQLKEQEEKSRYERQKQERNITDLDNRIVKQAEAFEVERSTTKLFLSRVAPIDLVHSSVTELLFNETWNSSPFYSHIGGYKLQLYMSLLYSYHFGLTLLESEFPVSLPCKLQVTLLIVDHTHGKHWRKQSWYVLHRDDFTAQVATISKSALSKFVTGNQLTFRVLEVKVLNEAPKTP